MLAQVRKTIAQRGLIAHGDHVLVACSGGPDSVALTHVLSRLQKELGLTLSVASVDHGLRAESPNEVAQVGELATRLALPFHALKVEVRGSLQAAARKARYAALGELARERGAHAIAVGHTQDDQAETVLHRLVRGSGLRGLAAIQPRRSDGVVRPLIDVTRADVIAHLEHAGLSAIMDPSNRDRRFTRVRVRSEWLPMLTEENPQLALHLAALADEARETEVFMASLAAPIANEEGESPRVAILAGLPKPLQRAVFRAWLTPHIPALKASYLQELSTMVRKSSGEVRLPGGRNVTLRGGRLVLST